MKKILTDVFANFCPVGETVEVLVGKDNFFAGRLGKSSGIGVNFNPSVPPESESFPPCFQPCLMIWDTFPKKRSHNRDIASVYRICVTADNSDIDIREEKGFFFLDDREHFVSVVKKTQELLMSKTE